MKSFKLYLSSLLLLLGLGAVSCSDDFDTPPTNVPEATITANTTIAELKAEYWQDGQNYVTPILKKADGSDVVIKGRVISSDAAGNIYKQLYIQDETGAICLSIDANSLYTTYREGQEIVIDMNTLYAGKYAGLLQIGVPDATNPAECGRMALALFQKQAQLNKLPDLASIDTIVTKITDLPTSVDGLQKWQCQLVRFNNVHWKDAGKPYCDPSSASTSGYANTSRDLVDADGNTIIVRNSGYANFKAELLPSGVGSVVGILGYYNGAWQVLLRSTADCIDFEPASTDGTKDDPYSTDEAIALQGKGKEGWTEGYIVGAVAPGVTTVTSSSNIQWEAPTVLANTIVIAPTADTKDVTKCLIINLVDGSALRTAANLKDNPTVYKKQIKVTGILEHFMGQAGVTTSGSESSFVIQGVTPSGGDGTQANPFTVSQIVSKTATGTDVWAKGYIVGWVEGADIKAGAHFNASPNGSTPVSASNVLLAASATETNVDNCVPIQLVYNTAPRTDLNLADHPTNLGKYVELKGTIATYFGVPGLKTVTEYSWGSAASKIVLK